MNKKQLLFYMLIGFTTLSSNTWANNSLSNCAEISNQTQRLICYDSLSSQTTTIVSPEPDQLDFFSSPETASIDIGNRAAQHLEQIWELESRNKAGVFRFRPYRENSILFWRHTDQINQVPASPNQSPPAYNPGLTANELNYQLSFKLKLWQNILNSPLDLWFTYTQRSYWQLYNQDASLPFRENNYEPELILTLPLQHELLGLELKMINFGLSHQSNGLSNPYSRNFHRFYVQLAMQKENLILSLRAWSRINDQASSYENPDIDRYMGNGEVHLTWLGETNVITALARYNPDSDKGALKLNWSFPVQGRLNAYTEFFTGYGDSLIDYNHQQNIFGFGILISTWP